MAILTTDMRFAQIAGLLILGVTGVAGQAPQQSVTVETKQTETPARHPVAPPDSVTENTVTVGGQAIAYRAVAGTLTVGASDAYDVLLGDDGQLLPDAVANPTDPTKPEDAPATARMFYVA